MLNLLKYDLIVSISTELNGVCGHTYEIIDYFYVLSNHFKCCILLPEKDIFDKFDSIIRLKYNFTENEISYILKHTYSRSFHTKVLGNNILLTDGVIDYSINKHYVVKKMLLFSCQTKIPYKNNNIIYLADNRIYNNGVHYVKKILFDKIKKPKLQSNNMLIYATQDCRNLDENYYDIIEQKYPNFNFTLLTNIENKPKTRSKFMWLDMPVDNIFEHFSTYLYTKTSTRFDCSPRFIAECKYFSKKVIYDIDYEDLGLKTRIDDIENNFKSLYLTDNDEIINIIKEHI